MTPEPEDELLYLVTDVYFELRDLRSEYGRDENWRRLHAYHVDWWLKKVETMYPDLVNVWRTEVPK